MQKVSQFDNAEILATAAADYFVQLGNECILTKGKFTVALSGGSTPIALFKLLASIEYANKIDWKKVYIFWGDERCVALDSPENNAYQATTILLDKVLVPKKNIFVIPVNETPTNAAIYYEATLKIFFKIDMPLFDLILLGLGDDGHTASLFPLTTILKEKTKLVKEVFLAAKNVWRVSFTEPLINNATHKLFLVVGKAKADILNTIINGGIDTQKYPAQMIKNAEWFVCV